MAQSRCESNARKSDMTPVNETALSCSLDIGKRRCLQSCTAVSLYYGSWPDEIFELSNPGIGSAGIPLYRCRRTRPHALTNCMSPAGCLCQSQREVSRRQERPEGSLGAASRAMSVQRCTPWPVLGEHTETFNSSCALVEI
jgi:hypothetical protein